MPYFTFRRNPAKTNDGLSSFQIQDLMSAYNQSATLSSSVQRKKDETAGGVIGKI